MDEFIENTPMNVIVYSAGKIVGRRRIYDANDLASAIGSVMTEDHLSHAAARYEDDNKSGAWVLVGDERDNGAGDIPAIVAAEKERKL